MMAKCTETCPKCGADFDKVITEPDNSSRYWDCYSYERTFHDTTEFFNQSLRCENRCLKQQLATANVEIEQLKDEMGSMDLYIQTLRNLLISTYHTLGAHQMLSSAETWNDVANQLRTEIEKTIFPKEDNSHI